MYGLHGASKRHVGIFVMVYPTVCVSLDVPARFNVHEHGQAFYHVLRTMAPFFRLFLFVRVTFACVLCMWVRLSAALGTHSTFDYCLWLRRCAWVSNHFSQVPVAFVGQMHGTVAVHGTNNRCYRSRQCVVHLTARKGSIISNLSTPVSNKVGATR